MTAIRAFVCRTLQPLTVYRRAATWLSHVTLALAFGTTTAHAQLPTVRVAPTIAVSGSNVALQMTLPSPAPAAGVPLRLSSSNPAAAVFVSSGSGSLSTTIPGGQTTLAVSIRTLGVAVPTSVVFTVATSVGSLRTSLTVNPASVSAVAVQQTTGPGGAERQGTVTLNGVGAAGSGTSVALTLSDPVVGAVPATVTVPEGLRSATFQILTQPVATVTSASISATTGSGTVAKGAFTLTPPALRAVTLSPPRVVGGTAFSGTITLDAPAPASGVTVTFATSPTTNVMVLRDVVIPPRATQATFSIATTTVSARVDAVLSATATNGAAAGGVTTAFSVVPLDVAGVSASALHVYGGDVTDITVRLSGTAVRDQTVALRAEQTGGAVTTIPFQLPASVTIPAGSDRVTLRLTTQTVATPLEFRLVAGASGAAVTPSNSVPLGIHARPLVRAITVSPAPVVATLPAGVTVQLAWPVGPTFATTPVLPPSLVTFTSDSPLIPPGPALPVAYLQSQLRTTLPVGPSSASANVTLGARSGTSALTTTVNIVPPPVAVSAVQLALTSVLGGGSTTGTLVLSRAADPAGLSVTVVTSTAAAAVPATVQVPGGARQVTFPVTTSPVDESQSVTVTATAPNTVAASASLRIVRLAVASIASSTAAAYGGGQAITVTLALNGVAPANGAPVMLGSALPGVTLANGGTPLPAIVTVPTGSGSTTIAVRLPAVTTLSEATLRAVVVPPASTTSPATLLAATSAVTAPLVAVPTPGDLRIRSVVMLVDVDRPTGLLNVEFTTAPSAPLSAALLAALPPVRLVVDSDRPEVLRADSVLFVQGTTTYRFTMRTTAPINDVELRLQVRGPGGEQSPLSSAVLVPAPKLYQITAARSVVGGNPLQVTARLTRGAGPGGVQGVFRIQGNVVRSVWPAGSDLVQVTVPTTPTFGRVDASLTSEAITAVEGGSTSSKFVPIDVLGTGVIDLLNNGATTLMAGDSTSLSAVLQNPVPVAGFQGVEFVSSDPALLINGGVSTVTMPRSGAASATQIVKAAAIGALPAVTRPVTVRAQSVHAARSGTQSNTLFVVPPPNLLALVGPSNAITGGQTFGVTVSITPYERVGTPFNIAIPIRIESSHPSLVPPSIITLRLDSPQGGASLVAGRPTTPTKVTLNATAAGKTVSTTILVLP